jgi:hypothetical protein
MYARQHRHDIDVHQIQSTEKEKAPPAIMSLREAVTMRRRLILAKLSAT